MKGHYHWPFAFEPEPPPCLLVGGADREGVNKITTAPEPDPLWPCWIRSIDSIPETMKDAGWTIRPLARGRTPGMQSLKCHVSRLAPGTIPHPPHTHEDEELLVVLNGELELMTGEAGSTRADMNRPIRAGQLAYNAAELLHTMRAVGSEPAEYVVLKWRAETTGQPGDELASAVYPFWPVTLEVKRPGRQRHQILGGPTRYLGRLSSHLTVLEPGGGYDPHRDPYDVAIVVLEGTLETLGQRVGPRSVVFYPAEERHGARNVGSSPSRHLVFEFHPPA